MQVLPGSGRAAERLDSELIGWISTVTRNGRPQSSPVWFVVHDGKIYIQSQPEAAKLANVRTNDKVSFHLDSDGAGGDIVTMSASVIRTHKPGHWLDPGPLGTLGVGAPFAIPASFALRFD